MCFVQDKKNKALLNSVKGQMPFENAKKIFNEVKSEKPMVTPHQWSEPFMMKDFCKYVRLIKSLDMPVIMHTNGLLLSDKIMKELVEMKIDSINFSIDAVTPRTLEKIRGVRALDKIKDTVFSMLRIRGNQTLPRISTSFVVTGENREEEKEFISFWLQHVDMVRVNAEYKEGGSVNGMKIPEKRIPCGLIYDTININHRGGVTYCCLDVFSKTNLGNVLKDGVKKVWHSERFKELRHYHETSQYDKVPFCKDCRIWMSYLVEETAISGILIRKSPLLAYYNRMDRLGSWKAGRPNGTGNNEDEARL